MKQRIAELDVAAVIRIVRLIPEYKFLGQYQIDILAFLITNPNALLLASRQAGKTEMVALLVAIYVLFGHKCLIAMQTTTSGYDIFTARINYFLNCLAIYFPVALARDRDFADTRNRMDYVVCRNGGGFKILSSDDAFKRNEGWTATVLVIDEAHLATDSFFGKVRPTLTLAIEQGIAKTIVMGVDGYRESLVHTLTTEGRGFTRGVWDCYRVLESRPTFQKVIDEQRETMSTKDFSQMYEMKAMASGVRYIFEREAHRNISRVGNHPVPYAGIDVGRKKDATVVSAGFLYEDLSLQATECLVIEGETFDNQAALITPWLNEREIPDPFVMIELNGIGQALFDSMCRFGNTNRYNGMNVTARTIEHLTEGLAHMSRRGKYGCSDEECRRELNQLTYEVKEDGSVDYEHSDYLASQRMLAANAVYR